MNVLVANAGSSSVKLRVLDPACDVLAASDLTRGTDLAAEVKRFVGAAPGFAAAGHRVVHGGAAFRDSVVVERARFCTASRAYSTSRRCTTARRSSCCAP